jgi:hypothetical protein
MALPAGNTRHDLLRQLLRSPRYYVLRVIQVTQRHWWPPESGS